MRLITTGLAVGPLLLVIVVVLVDIGEPESPDLAEGATLAAGVVGLIGLLIAAIWFSGAGDRPRQPAAVMNGFIIRLAIAELGLLLGILGLFMTGSVLPVVVGIGLFLPALLLLYLGMNRMTGV